MNFLMLMKQAPLFIKMVCRKIHSSAVQELPCDDFEANASLVQYANLERMRTAIGAIGIVMLDAASDFTAGAWCCPGGPVGGQLIHGQRPRRQTP
jgi:hypothetical protein